MNRQCRTIDTDGRIAHNNIYRLLDGTYKDTEMVGKHISSYAEGRTAHNNIYIYTDGPIAHNNIYR